jgi:hypothetical protein
MKKNILFLAITIFSCITVNSFAQKNRTLSNGFGINLIIGFPSGTYGVTSDSQIDDQYKFGSIWGLKLGNRWYFSPKEKFGFGLMVNWIDLTAVYKQGTTNSDTWQREVVDFSFLEFGPVATYAISNDIALDAYYNLRPTGFGSVLDYKSGTGTGSDETFTYIGVGISNALGAALRYKVLNVGFEYVFGSIKSDGTYSGPNDITLESQKNVINNFRIVLGVKL